MLYRFGCSFEAFPGVMRSCGSAFVCKHVGVHFLFFFTLVHTCLIVWRPDVWLFVWLKCVRVCVSGCVSPPGESRASFPLFFQRNWRRPGGNCTPLLRLIKTSTNQGLLWQSGIKLTATFFCANTQTHFLYPSHKVYLHTLLWSECVIVAHRLL